MGLLAPGHVRALLELQADAPMEHLAQQLTATLLFHSNGQPATLAAAVQGGAVTSPSVLGMHAKGMCNTRTLIDDERAEGVVAAFTMAAIYGLRPSALEEELRKSGLRSALPVAAAEVWAEFATATQGQLLAASASLESLIDVEWTFGGLAQEGLKNHTNVCMTDAVTASSSELEAVGSTYVQLRLMLSGDGGRARFAHIELSLPKFYELLHQLESAKAQLELL